MFDAVLQQREVPARRIGAGLVLAAALHVGAVGLIAYFSARHVIESRKPTEVVFRAALPPPPPPPPPPPLGGGAPKPKVEQPKKPVPVKKPDTFVEPKHKDEPEKPKEPEKPADTAPAQEGVPNGHPEGVPGGDPDHGVPGGQPGGVPGGTPGGTGTATVAPPPTNITLPFGEGMTPPSLVGGAAQPQYPREALEAKVEGKVIARCTITVAGTLTDCKIIKGLPFLDQAVLATLAGQRYSPVMYQGHPQSVFYTLTFRFKLP